MSDSFALSRLSAAQTALAEAKTLDDLKHIMGIAEAAIAYAKAAKMSIEVQNSGAELAIRAQRLAGEKLAQLERGKTGPKEIISTRGNNSDTSEYKAALEESDTSYQQANRWQAIASVPEEEFEKHIEQVMTKNDELTSAGVLRVGQQIKRENRIGAIKEAAALPDAKYRIIYADPPWPYDDTGVTTSPSYGGTKWHYPSMTAEELCALPVGAMADADSVLFMWATSPKLPEALRIIEAWGFDYKTSFVWDKVKHNFGYYNSVRHEFLLIAGRGRATPDTKTLYDSVQTIERTEHSVKPEEFRAIIDDLYPVGRRIELFARREAAGWERWGNE